MTHVGFVSGDWSIGTMEVTLDDLVDQWRGRHATLTIDLARAEDDDARQTFSYEGILDGPYLGNGPGVEFMLGGRVISGDIAVDGPLINFEPAQTDDSSKPVLDDAYVELRVVDLPLIVEVDADEARWEALLADRRAVRCRLQTSGTP
jgi:hypothetical protein